MPSTNKVVVIGLDGLEPTIVERLLQNGQLPNLARLRERGGYGRVATTTPAQTPVAWSTFATGVNPGGHGIFDFIRRDPKTYLPDLALNRYEQQNAFLPPKAVNLRQGTTVWETLASAGIASTILRCPCTYPPDAVKGRLLAGMGVPDIRGGLGTATFYTSVSGAVARESEQVVPLRMDGSLVRTHLIGPRNPKAGTDLTHEITLEVDAARRTVIVRSDGQPRTLELREGEWSGWLRVKFKAGLLQSVSGVLRFLLLRTSPELELYVSPVNFDPAAPMFPISAPWEYASDLQSRLGDTYYTTGMVEDHTGLSNGRFSEEVFLSQCEQVLSERERMMQLELGRMNDGLFYCLFDTPDRLQHMFWRFREAGHPANAANGDAARAPELASVIDDHYRACDAIVGRALAHAGDRTLVIVLSDHGFTSFQRGVHLNAWLEQNGFLSLRQGVEPGHAAGEMFRHVDWGRTRAYALGLGSIYLNLRGRETEGVVAPDDAARVSGEIARGLTGLVDAERGTQAIRGVQPRDALYSGRCAGEAPDLVVNFAGGYRVSWTTALGGIPSGLVEDNVKKWGGDHIVDPVLVPGVLFMNRPFRSDGARLVDLAPSILAALGVPKGSAMEGSSLLS